MINQNTICDYCLRNCTIGIDARKLDDNVICKECEEDDEK